MSNAIFSEVFNDTKTNEQIEVIAVLETQVDDVSSQVVSYVMQQLLDAGALDVFTQPVGMKKSRTGLLITVICPCDRIAICQSILFRETTTLGIRHRLQERTILNRQIVSVQTPYGLARVKIAQREDHYTIQPEYDDCVQLAQQHGIPLWQIQESVRQAGEAMLLVR